MNNDAREPHPNVLIESRQGDYFKLEEWQLEILTDACDEAKTGDGNADALQQVFDEVFTPERRVRLLRQAEEDIRGRKVRYFRVMSWEMLKQLLETGMQDTDSYDSVGIKITEPQLRAYFLSYLNWNETRDYLRFDTHYDDSDPRSTREIIERSCPDANKNEIDAVMALENNKIVRDFVVRHVHDIFVKIDHNLGVSNHMPFSPYLSVSVGGPAYGVSCLGEHTIKPIVELLIPSEQVEINSERPDKDMEQEVLVHTVKRNHIIRVHTSVNAAKKCLSQDLTSAAGEYHNRLRKELGDDKYRGRVSGSGFFDVWRGSESVADCLPISLREKLLQERVK